MFQSQIRNLPRSRRGLSERQPEALYNGRPIHGYVRQHIACEMIDPQRPLRETGHSRPTETFPSSAERFEKLRAIS